MGYSKKQYLRYVAEHVFGIIGTGNDIHFITRLNQRKFVTTSACEKVFLWDLRTKVKVLTLTCEDVTGTVSCILPRPPLQQLSDNTHIAVGYTDGTLGVFDTRVGQCVKFNGHKGAISTLAWDLQGMRVASGSEDGEIVIWDVVSERGMVRLKGHKGRINKVCFLQTRNVLVSCARDSFIKFWDLDTNYCFYTLAKHHTDVWNIVVLKNDTRLIVGGGNAELRVWALNFTTHIKDEAEDRIKLELEEPTSKLFIKDTELPEDTKVPVEDNDIYEENPYLKVKEMGYLLRSKAGRVSGMYWDGQTLAVHGKSSVVDTFTVFTDEEATTRQRKRLKKSKKRARESNTDEPEDTGLVLADEFKKLPSFDAAAKINGLDVHHSADVLKVAILHIDNSLAVYELMIDANNKSVMNQENSLYLPAHRNEIRCCSINSIGDQIVTASADSIKVWHRSDSQVVRSIPCDYPLSLLLPPGDRHVVIGTKFGHIQLFDLGSGSLVEDVEAHVSDESVESGIWALAITHDGRGFVSGGSDALVKFWTFDLVQDSDGRTGKRLSIVQESRALKVADQITAMKCSKSGKFIAVATFDLKETLYYMDSLKLVHEFYGKSMPSTCLDFSSDSTLVVTGSRDSCIRIFASDFGDQKKLLKNCHKGGVTDVQFIAKTHMFFSSGSDGSLSQWDADNFERIITLTGHHGIVRCLSVAGNGAFVVTCGQDRSIRLWVRTNEPLVLEDEREEERMREDEQGEEGLIQTPVVAGEKEASAVRPTKMSRDTERAADQLLEALAIYHEQKREGEKAKPNELMTLVYKTDDPLKFILMVLRKIKSSELEEAVLVLPLNLVLVLLYVLKCLLEKGWDVELSARVLVVALRTNLPQLVASKHAIPIIRALATVLPMKTKSLQDLVGFNMAGLQYMQTRLEQRTETQLFVEAAHRVKDRIRKKKRKARIAKRAILTI